jgi:hypothetical protein
LREWFATAVAASAAVVAVLLVKPALRTKIFEQELSEYGRHFVLPTVHDGRKVYKHKLPVHAGLYVLAYSDLSQTDNDDVLTYFAPDLVVADEAHVFRRKLSARSKRFFRYMEDHPATRFVPMSGSFLKKSCLDVTRTFEAALKKDSPVPTGRTAVEWAWALDPSVEAPKPAGKLMLLCAPGTQESQDAARHGYRRRVQETPGVITTSGDTLETALTLQFWRSLKVNKATSDAMEELEKLWMFQDEEIPDVLTYTRIAKQLASGFYYKWVWPGGKKSPEDEAWLAARNNWNREVREFLQYNRQDIDTALQVWNLVERGGGNRDLRAAFDEWKKWHARPEPPTETVWLDKELMLLVAHRWVREIAAVDVGHNGLCRGIIWYEFTALHSLFREAGWPVFGPGDRAAAELDRVRAPYIVVSQNAYREGKNLQRYWANLVLNPPATGDIWEQMVGRTHREGQQADEVIVTVLQHTSTLFVAMKNALRDAAFIQSMSGQRQRIVFADKIGVGDTK